MCLIRNYVMAFQLAIMVLLLNAANTVNDPSLIDVSKLMSGCIGPPGVAGRNEPDGISHRLRGQRKQESTPL